jgi:hypothetical protein
MKCTCAAVDNPFLMLYVIPRGTRQTPPLLILKRAALPPQLSRRMWTTTLPEMTWDSNVQSGMCYGERRCPAVKSAGPSDRPSAARRR